MKRSIIAILVGTVVLFVYQAMSWMVLPIHNNSFMYTSRQDSILATLSGLEEGYYSLPGKAPGTTDEEHHKNMESMNGKPWAMVHYHHSFSMNMGPSMLRGFSINLIAVWIVVMILSSAAGVFNTFRSRLWVSLLFAIFCITQSNLMDWNWFETPMHYTSGAVIDKLLGWLLTGSWLAWYMGRKQAGASE